MFLCKNIVGIHACIISPVKQVRHTETTILAVAHIFHLAVSGVKVFCGHVCEAPDYSFFDYKIHDYAKKL